MPILRLTFAVVLLSLGLAGPASALSFKDIAGKWCGPTISYQFTRNSLTVVFFNGTPTRHYKITDYKFNGDTVTVDWLSGTKEFSTDFSEFDADRRSMAQQKNKAGPRRPFKRCR